MNVNKCFLAGNLTRDVELRQTQQGQAVANLGLAVNRRYRTRDGADREDCCFVDAEAWGRIAEVLAEHVRKGDPLFVEGRLKFNAWEEHGKNRSKLSVVVERFEFVGGRSGGGSRKQQSAAARAADDDIPY